MRFRTLVFAASAAVLACTAAAHATTINDPVRFVKSVYAAIKAGKPAPEDINTPHLQRLYDLNAKEFGKDEVGRIDFDIFMNAQDAEISDLSVRGVPVDH